MQNVSQAYKDSMRKSFRNFSFVKVEYGVFNEDAKNSAVLSVTSGKPYSTTDIKGEDPLPSYFSFEPGRNRLDKELLVPPVSGYVNTGFVSSEMSDESGVFLNPPTFTITFEYPENLLGLTLSFDTVTGEYPAEIELNGEVFYPNNSTYVIDKEILQQQTLTLKILKSKQPYRFARVSQILFGQAVRFTDNEITKLSLSSTVDMLSASLSKKKLTFSLDNSKLEYNPIVPTGMLQYTEERQPISVSFGYQLDDGSIEWVQKEQFTLDGDPSTSDILVNFTAQDSLNFLTGQFKKGLYRPEGISLYDLAIEVLEDAGVEDYALPEYLKTVMTKAALPIATHRECLQIIANAGQCILYTDREGKIHISVAFEPTITPYDNGHVSYSDTESAFNSLSLPEYKYATLFPDSMKLNDERYLVLPTDKSKFVQQGFVSDKICDAEGVFSDYPIYGLKYSFPYTSFIIPITFDHIAEEYATEFRVVYLLDGSQVDELLVTGNTQVRYEVQKNVNNFDEIQIEIHKWSHGYRRATINQVGEGRINDFMVDLGMSKKQPEVKKLKPVKNVSVMMYNYNPQAELSEIYNEPIEGADNTVIEIEHEGATNVSATFSGGQIVSQVHYTYLSILTITGSGTLVLSGNKIDTATNTVVRQLNIKGEEKEPLQNPLITNLQNAQKSAIWIGDYYNSRNQLSVTYRGSPELDAYDLIYMSSQFKNVFPVRIMEHKIDFNGALSGTMKVVGV